jgi:hypothetical protein
MQVFINISSRGCFYSIELYMSAFTGWLELWWAPFLLRSRLLLGTGSIQILSYTLQRWSLVPLRDQSLVVHPSCMLVHTSFVWGPIDDPSQSLFFSATSQTHPFVSPPAPVPHMWTVWRTGPHLYTMGKPYHIGRLFGPRRARTFTLWVEYSGWPLQSILGQIS